MRKYVYLFCFLLSLLTAQAQSPFVPLNTDYYHLIDRLEIRQNRWANGFHSSVKPYNRQSIIELTDSLAANPGRDFSDTDYFNYDYLRDDSWEWVSSAADSLRSDPFLKHLRPLPGPGDSERPLLKVFYQKKADFYSLRTPDIDLHVNPVVYVGIGLENVAREAGTAASDRQSLFVNTRGLEVRGTIGRKLGFYSFFSDNQAIYPEYIQNYGRTYSRSNGLEGSAPGESFTKRYGENGVDFLSARGYITFNALKVINIQFGHDRNFFGNGFRSLFLSDNSPSSLFMKFSTRLGKRIQYTNLYTQLQNTQAPLNTAEGERLIPPKFAAMHHLSINVNDHLNFGVFEAEVFSRDRVDLSYLNPVILYRYVESSRGSADNAMIGLDVKGNFLSHFLVYSQLMLDEFLLKNLKAGKGDWTNKFAWQIGAKYIDAFNVPNLDLQVEMNLARPFTYSHEKSATVSAGQTNYANYSQPLAHPLGANFVEMLGIVRYQQKKLSANGIFGIMTYGADPPGLNYGGNILLDYRSRFRNEGNFIGQGRKNIITYVDLRGSYMVRHNIFLEARYLYRHQDSQSREDTYTNQVASLALRWNLPYRNWVF
ncbi:hypothetical protein [Spirosoma utsteinense]|uniref:Capsule assembly Wzi family protein n=1 Tax=Spirosoma utsteinense TaxID=2585773 RepID=A0ABR6W3Z2_9BACT|nr:hypothetical protein [Spirosoma utsteinense]MBC3784343.1 hypothetical protein [Spirosoma utsteinense]MBC3790858.1 hypothetical protein [Spirosoma utsteinense]